MVNNIGWITAPFLWIDALKDKNNLRFKQPAILRFDNDNFMEYVLRHVDQDPSLLKDYVARYETWTDKNVGWLQESDLLSQSRMLKLYQPVHGYFYLVTASLVCQIPGFPDRKVDSANEEKVSFVIRRLMPKQKDIPVNPKYPQTYNEYARVGQDWRLAPSIRVLDKEELQPLILDEEERQPLFELNFMEKGRRRRLLAGVIPVANREKYQIEPKYSPPAKPPPGTEDELAKDPRMPLFETRIIDPMKDLRVAIGNGQIDYARAREVLVQILMDMADFLRNNSEEVWNAILSRTWSGTDNSKESLFIRLKRTVFLEKNSTLLSDKKYWSDALYEISDKKDVSITTLDQIRDSIDNLLYQISDLPDLRALVKNAIGSPPDPRLTQFETYVAEPLSGLLGTITGMSDEQARQVFLFIILDFAQFLSEYIGDVWEDIKNDNWTGTDENRKKLFDELKSAGLYSSYHWDDALREVWDKKANVISGETVGSIITGLKKESIISSINGLGIRDPEYRKSIIYEYVKNILTSSTPVEKPQETQETTDPSSGAIYFIRCVYDRRKCKNISSAVVSEPSQAFQFAPFYDPDAPSRPVRIPMPIDTSISGLRKYPRNVSFVISDTLKQQMERIKGKKLTALDDGNINPEGKLGLGMICSFSIPIITICALILLMIIVQLLNIIFWWLPFFRICLPLNLKAK